MATTIDTNLAGGITLGDVARIAGVSPITASRALNSPDQVAPETLARVRDAVARATFQHLIGFQMTDAQLRYNATR